MVVRMFEKVAMAACLIVLVRGFEVGVRGRGVAMCMAGSSIGVGLAYGLKWTPQGLSSFMVVATLLSIWPAWHFQPNPPEDQPVVH